MEYITHTLSNGLRMVHLPSESPVAYCGFTVNAGARDENPEEHGLAHFVEHILFKGTEKHRANYILNRMEQVGGELNAYTTKEETFVYSIFMREHFLRAFDLLVDLVFHSIFPEAQIEKERDVILDEISSYEDSPSELIFDDFENLLFKGHALGHNILGDEASLEQLGPESGRSFMRRFYTPDNMVFFSMGNVPFGRIVQWAERLMCDIPSQPHQLNRQRPERVPSSLLSLQRDTHQAHVMIGNRAYSMYDDKRIALFLLNNILGGPGMSSRFNLILRENNGLVYTVESNMTSYTDTGIWSVYFGCDPHDVKRCTRLIRKELERWTRSPISDRTLAAAKRQIKGQIGISYDNFENVALAIGKTYLHYQIIRNQEELYKKIDAVSAQELHQVACELFAPDKLSILIYQ